MARRRRLTDAQVESLPTKGARYTYPDPELPGHYVRIYPTGKRSFVTVKDNVWTTIGDTRTWTIEKAREKARCIRRTRLRRNQSKTSQSVTATSKLPNCGRR